MVKLQHSDPRIDDFRRVATAFAGMLTSVGSGMLIAGSSSHLDIPTKNILCFAGGLFNMLGTGIYGIHAKLAPTRITFYSLSAACAGMALWTGNAMDSTHPMAMTGLGVLALGTLSASISEIYRRCYYKEPLTSSAA